MNKTRWITRRKGNSIDEIGTPFVFIEKKKKEPMDASHSSYVIFEIESEESREKFVHLLTELSFNVEVEQLSSSTYRIDKSQMAKCVAELIDDLKLNPKTDRIYVLDTRRLLGTRFDGEIYREVDEWNLADHKIFPGSVPSDFDFPDVNE